MEVAVVLSVTLTFVIGVWCSQLWIENRLLWKRSDALSERCDALQEQLASQGRLWGMQMVYNKIATGELTSEEAKAECLKFEKENLS